MRTMLAALFVAASAVLMPVQPALALQEAETKDVELKYGNVITHLKVGDWLTEEKVTKLDNTKVYVLDFWSGAAQGCKRSIPMMHELSVELADKGLRVVGITSDKTSDARDYMKDKMNIMTYPIAVMKENSGGQSEMWRKVAKLGLLPMVAIINRPGQICYVGSPFDDKFVRILNLALADRYDTELLKQAEPMLGAARRAARIRNFREASRHYSEIVKLNPKHFADVALEQWRMIADQQGDIPQADLFIRMYIEMVNAEIPALVFVGNYLATSTESKHRDLDAAQLIADKLRQKAPSDPDALACIAAVQAAKGDFPGAAETQYDAWLAATPMTKAAFKRALDLYRKGQTAVEPAKPADDAGKETAGDAKGAKSGGSGEGTGGGKSGGSPGGEGDGK